HVLTQSHRLEKLVDLAAHSVYLSAQARGGLYVLGARVLSGERFCHVDKWPEQAITPLLRQRCGWKGRNASIEQDVPQQRFSAIVGRVAKRKDGTPKLGRNFIQMVAAMPAAYIATMGNILRDQTQRCGIVAQNPIDAERPDLVFECHNRKLELSLLQRDGN